MLKLSTSHKAYWLNWDAWLEARQSATPYTPYPLAPWIAKKVRRDYAESGKLCNAHLCRGL